MLTCELKHEVVFNKKLVITEVVFTAINLKSDIIARDKLVSQILYKFRVHFLSESLLLKLFLNSRVSRNALYLIDLF
jgi:hypothetical protein